MRQNFLKHEKKNKRKNKKQISFRYEELMNIGKIMMKHRCT